MMTGDQLLAKLRSRHPKLGDTEGMVALAEAYRSLAAEERWSFLVEDVTITTVASTAEYAAPSDLDYGRDFLIWDVARNLELPMISLVDMRRMQSTQQEQEGVPEAVCRAQIQQSTDGNLNPLETLLFGPLTPDAAYDFVVFYYRKPPALTGIGKPIWPENFEDLIWRLAEILLEENPRHRIVLARSVRQRYSSRLWALKKMNDGGAEIERRISLMGEGFSSMNVNFTSSGINPLAGG